MLQLSRQARLVEVAKDEVFLRDLAEVYAAYKKYLGRKDTYGKQGVGRRIKKPIAYFSAEFGFHDDEARVFCRDLSDHRRFFAQRVLPHRCDCSTRLPGRNDCDQLSFICDI